MYNQNIVEHTGFWNYNRLQKFMSLALCRDTDLVTAYLIVTKITEIQT